MAGVEYKQGGQANPAADPSCRTLYIADLPPYFDDVLLRNVFTGNTAKWHKHRIHWGAAFGVCPGGHNCPTAQDSKQVDGTILCMVQCNSDS